MAWTLRRIRAIVFGDREHAATRNRSDRHDERTVELAEPEVNAEKPKPKIA